MVAVPVAVRLPPMYASPATERRANGEVVAIPRLPEKYDEPTTSRVASDDVALPPRRT